VLLFLIIQEARSGFRGKNKRVPAKGPGAGSGYLKPGNKYKTFVAVIDNKVVGYLMGYPSLGAPEVDNMYDILPVSSNWTPPEFFLQITFVSRPFRNQGISKALHREIIEYVRKQGHKEVYACIAKWNLPEIKVIRSLKFKLKDLGYRYRLTLKF